MAIFSDKIGNNVEVFMDDFSVFGTLFDECLHNLGLVLKRCVETNLVLNREKCHIMVVQGIILGHKVSSKGLEVNKTKMGVIENLHPPISVKGILYYASKILNGAQLNYTTTEKELLVIVYGFEKFRSYLLGTKEFELEIKDRKGTENQVVDHLSRLEDPITTSQDKSLINESFPDEQLFGVQAEEPWFAEIVNYLVSNVMPPDLTSAQRKKFLHEVKWYMYDEPFLFRQGADQIIRRCIPYSETGGSYKIIIQWLMEDIMVEKRQQLVFFKEVEVNALPTNDAKVVLNFLHKQIFTRFGTPRIIISDKGSHFCNRKFTAMQRYNMNHRIATAYDPQMNGQAELVVMTEKGNTWLNLSKYTKGYMDGVKLYVKKAMSNFGKGDEIKCPCRKCENRLWWGGSDVESRLIWSGPSPPFIQSIYDVSLLPDKTDNVEFEHNTRFGDNLDDMLDVRLYHWKCLNGVTEVVFGEILQLLKEDVPDINVPSTFNLAKNIIKDLGLDYKKIDACPNDCILYWGDNKDRVCCKTCGVSRWKGVEQGQEQELDVNNNRIPAKVMRFFPLIPRLQRLYMCKDFAKKWCGMQLNERNMGSYDIRLMVKPGRPWTPNIPSFYQNLAMSDWVLLQMDSIHFAR
ncbi:hypothetical protein AgCh_003903 [Apium graveolens]